ncbi:glycosyl transferase family 2 [Pedobacter sp. Leaf41]|jgi:GT2 family glycosyltransferase|uniref:glycosyltransferase family 2 protein n=1 Tax=Pedobacter sp. Leaf41 TaxID=1736218 RepID=UPI000702CF9F|nr:glycosyltransferase family 2 protein [Pedobacter sp. Leaf41]KQN38824.1 glycosyl transferase family 2 [Pedobacter sp. Leaf41]RZL61652.1 MAG: glycosyltransferase family 2 protein [Pedobacter sp.]
MNPSVAVVILNWNGKAFLQKFLPGILLTQYDNLQIIVGDNASTDDSVAFLQTHFPTVKIIKNDLNYGFAGGYNKVLERVEAEYFVLLNSDVEVTSNWVRPVIDLMESDDSIAAAQPKIKSQLKKSDFEYAGAAGGYLDIYAYPFCRGRLFNVYESDEGQYNDQKEIFWASGAAFFIKSRCWIETGGLDADLFAHMEEIDLCWRLKNLNYKIMYCPTSEVFHVGGGTLQTENPFKTYLNFRNNLIIMQKNLPASDAFFRIGIRMWIDFVAWWHFLLSGKPKFTLAVTRGHWHFIKSIAKTNRKRRSIQKPYAAHAGVYNNSVVWAFFIKKIKYFSKLY